MTENQNPTLNQPIGKIVAWGAGLAVGGVLLFGLTWIGLGALGVGQLPRLVVAVCGFPLVMSVVALGAYARQSQHTNSD